MCLIDLFLQVNQTEMRGKTREDAVLMLLSLQEHVELLVQYKPHGAYHTKHLFPYVKWHREEVELWPWCFYGCSSPSFHHNDINDMRNKTVLFSSAEYDRLMQSGGTGDNFYVKVHFNYDHTEHGETSFKNGEVFHVTDTLYGGVVGSWQAYKVGRNNNDTKKGIIPNKNR